MEHWPARKKWDMDYLEAKCTKKFPVNITPDGRVSTFKY